jgi:uncharacterized membrane protein
MPLTDSSLLKSIPLFAQLAEGELAELAALLKTCKYQPNQPIFWIGDKGTDFFVVHEGRVILTCPDEAGGELEIATLGPGSFFGEISLLDGGPRTTSARAEGNLTLLSLGRDDFLQFLRTKPSAAIHIMTVLGQRTRGMLDKLRGIRNVNEVDVEINRLQRIVDKGAAIGASGWFIICNAVFIVVWILVHTILWKFVYHREIKLLDEPPTYFWLVFVITLEAITLTMFVLTRQNRQAQRDRIRADLDYQVNVKAHLEVMQLHQKIDRLQAMLSENKAIQSRSGNGTSGIGSPFVGDTVAPLDVSKMSAKS